MNDEQHIDVTTVRLHDGAVQLAVAGDLDRATTAEFSDRVHTWLDAPRVSRLDLDLSGVGFCDLGGLRALHALGGPPPPPCPVRIVAAGPAVPIVLRLCGIRGLLGFTAPP